MVLNNITDSNNIEQENHDNNSSSNDDNDNDNDINILNDTHRCNKRNPF